MTAPVLSFRHVFGLKSDVSAPLLHVDDVTVLYCAGHQVILHDTATGAQRALPATSAENSQPPHNRRVSHTAAFHVADAAAAAAAPSLRCSAVHSSVI